MKKNGITIILTLIVILSSVITATASNPLFKTRKQSPSLTEQKADSDFYSSHFSGILYTINVMQKNITGRLAASIKKIEKGSTREIIFLIFVSFLYGVVHALGPGHGKSLISSYFLTRDDRVMKGLVAGPMIALLHCMSAIVIIGTLYYILKNSFLVNFEKATGLIKSASFIIIIFIGLYLFVRNIVDFYKWKRSN